MTTGRRVAAFLLAGAATLIVLLAMTTILAPPTMLLLAVKVVAAELSPVLALVAALLCLPANRLLRAHPAERWTLIALLAASAVLLLRPLSQFEPAANRAAEAVGAGSGPTLSIPILLQGPAVAAGIAERMVTYRAADGSALHMRVFDAGARAPRPAVVVIYGGGWSTGDPAQSAVFSRHLASAGYLVANIDYRHAPRAHGRELLDDVRSGATVLRDSASTWRVDTSRIAYLGRSSGGHLAELMAFTDSILPAAVVAFYAPYDLVEGYRDLPSVDPIGVQAVLRRFVGGTPEERPEAYRELSPAAHIAAGLPPVLLVFGSKDNVVKPEFNRRAARELHGARARVSAVEIPWAEHGFDMVPGGLGAQISTWAVDEFLRRAFVAPGMASGLTVR